MNSTHEGTRVDGPVISPPQRDLGCVSKDRGREEEVVDGEEIEEEEKTRNKIKRITNGVSK